VSIFDGIINYAMKIAGSVIIQLLSGKIFGKFKYMHGTFKNLINKCALLKVFSGTAISAVKGHYPIISFTTPS